MILITFIITDNNINNIEACYDYKNLDYRHHCTGRVVRFKSNPS